MILRPSSSLALSLLALSLAACGKEPADKDVAKMDGELVGNASEADPALTSALQDQIMVDPDLIQQSNDHSARPADSRRQAPIPPGTASASAGRNSDRTLGELAKAQAGGNCTRDLKYSTAWANRLPAAIPLYPDARVSEAAGNDLPGCDFRVVSFASAAPMRTLIDWYHAAAIRAGYSSERQTRNEDQILAGARQHDSSAYFISFTERPGGGTDVDLIANNGR